MSTRTVNFTRDFLDHGDLADLALVVVNAMIDSGRFYRSKKGGLLFAPDPDFPSDFVGLSRPSEIESVLRAGLVLKLAGDAITSEEMRALCSAILDHRWRIPHVSKAPMFAPLRGPKS